MTTYDQWKTTDPADEFLGPDPNERDFGPTELDLVYEDLARAHAVLSDIAKLPTRLERRTDPGWLNLNEALDRVIEKARTAIAKIEFRS